MDDLSSTYTRRGKGSCPKCGTDYPCRYKPEKCSKCDFHLGGSFQPKKPKRAKACCPDVVEVVSQSIYSVKTSSKDDRCFVVKEGKDVICLHNDCKMLRSSRLASGQLEKFICKHVELINSTALDPPEVYFLSKSSIDTYSGGESAKSMLMELLKSVPEKQPSIVRASEKSLVVMGQPSATNPIGYCHVGIESNESEQFQMKCKSKGCRQFVSKSKQMKARITCEHLHVIYCLLYQNKSAVPPPLRHYETSTVSTAPDPNTVIPSSRETTLQVAMNRSLPYHIPSATIQTIMRKDAASLLQCSDGWPDIYIPCATECTLCNSPLSEPRQHMGQSSNDTGYLITESNPFKRIKLLVKICTNPQCKAMHQSNLFDLGLFNICDKIAVSLDILLELREFFKYGHPLTNVISCKIKTLKTKTLKENLPTSNQQNYIETLLYNGFYCFEATSQRDLNEVVCGICGYCPELLLGDGNEKNCCRNGQILYNVPDAEDHCEISQSAFLQKLKKRWIEKSTLTRANEKFSVSVSEIPPIMAPAVLGQMLYNTELKKKSVYLKENSQPDGDPAMLHQMITREGLDICSIDSMSQESLLHICKTCGIVYAGKSKAKMITDISSLYSSMLVGLCPCHGYNRARGCTGGFYHLVCRHGCTYGSKLLTLTESVRDAADLYLSMKYVPTTFICDSPCGLARHLELREKTLTTKLWEDNCACFERPTIDKPPSQVPFPNQPTQVRIMCIPQHQPLPTRFGNLHKYAGIGKPQKELAENEEHLPTKLRGALHVQLFDGFLSQ
ncbi:HMG domain-containing protein 3 [Exaiptasia diaphana]|nr:HMG domain-containing protein 3 [Exaiptasia diaphana]